jgi:hypothetical protein
MNVPLSPTVFRLLRLGVFDEQFPTEISVNFVSLFNKYKIDKKCVPVTNMLKYAIIALVHQRTGHIY